MHIVSSVGHKEVSSWTRDAYKINLIQDSMRGDAEPGHITSSLFNKTHLISSVIVNFTITILDWNSIVQQQKKELKGSMVGSSD